jgi:hypothetical protein
MNVIGRFIPQHSMYVVAHARSATMHAVVQYYYFYYPGINTCAYSLLLQASCLKTFKPQQSYIDSKKIIEITKTGCSMLSHIVLLLPLCKIENAQEHIASIG